ncbi:MAG: hypothetical protein H6Q49_1192 [Deltaproteobacteria bacterium]|nr:hypothetical protein [Deltaproteobacteria bacterium]
MFKTLTKHPPGLAHFPYIEYDTTRHGLELLRFLISNQLSKSLIQKQTNVNNGKYEGEST